MSNALVPMSSNLTFDDILKQADILAKSRIIPKAYQTRPADIVASGLAGLAFGWDVMTSLRNYHVIEGTASLRPEAMLGLVRRGGHSVHLTLDDDPVHGRQAKAHGKRIDSGDEHTACFSTADAKNAGLLHKNNWKQYEDAMLTWRSVSALCRVLFPDVVLGAGYVPEEIGGSILIDEATDPLDEDLIRSAEAKTQLIEACLGDKEQARSLWGDRGNTPIRISELVALIAESQRSEIVDAIVVVPNEEVTVEPSGTITVVEIEQEKPIEGASTPEVPKVDREKELRAVLGSLSKQFDYTIESD